MRENRIAIIILICLLMLPLEAFAVTYAKVGADGNFNGDINIPSGFNYLINETQISSADLSDVASIAMLDENNFFTTGWLIISGADDTPFCQLEFISSRDGTPTYNLSNNDSIGEINFQGSASGEYLSGANIGAFVDGTPGTKDMPGRLEFSTTPDGSTVPIKRMAIDSAGNIKMGDGIWTNYVNVSAGGVLTFEGTASINEPLSILAATTSAELAGVISDETGTDKLVYNTSPTLVTPVLGVATGTSFQGIVGNVTPAAGTFTDLKGASTKGVILGDATAGRVLRKIAISMEDGTNANTIKITIINKWNGDSSAAVDNIAKNAATGIWLLNATGNRLTLLNTGIFGDAVTALMARVYYNDTGTAIPLVDDLLDTVNAGIQFQFSNATTGADVDLTALLTAGKYFQMNVLYLTTE